MSIASPLRRALRSVRARARRLGERALEPYLGSVFGVDTARRVAALTFDDGPHPEYTPRLLDSLARHGARATFFVVGAAVRAQPELAARIVAEGHALANHTWDHRSLPTLSPAARLEQLRRCAAALAPYGGDHGLLRPPFGNQSRASRVEALRLGYQVIAWSDHAEDWLERDAAFIAERLAAGLEPGAILLLHDSLYRVAEPERADRSPTLAAVEATLARFPDYAFVTVPELLASGRLRRRMWFKNPEADWLARFEGVADPFES